MKYICCFIILFSCLYVHAADVKFYHINSIHGISMRKITSICQDDNGFIWGASKRGVLRIAENDCRVYDLPYSASDVLSVKLANACSNLYAVSNNGQLFLFDKVYDKFVLKENLREWVNDKYLNIIKMVVAHDGSIWFATSVGLIRYKDDTPATVAEDKKVVQAVLTYEGDYLIYCTREAIKRIDMRTLETEVLLEKAGLNISTFYCDARKQCLWVGTFSEGLFFLDLGTKEYVKTGIRNFPRQPVLAIEQNTDSTFLVGIDGKGIYELDQTGHRVLNVYKENSDNPSSLRGDGVYDIFCDDNKRVWVATYSGGLSFFEQEPPTTKHLVHQINNPNSLGNNNVTKILEDSNGYHWFATDNGISRWDRKNDKWDIYFQDKQDEAQTFLALCEDNNGNIWAGTYSSGVYVLDGKTGKVITHYYNEDDSSGFTSKFVFDIFKDSQGDIWIGGIRSLVLCYLTEEKRFRTYSERPISSFYELEPGKILAACSYGLLLLDKATGKVDILLEGNVVHDCVILGDDFWVATGGNGLIRYHSKTGETESFTTDSGILSNDINSLVYSNGYLMLGTENGLCRFNLGDYTVHTYPSVFSFSNISYNTAAKCKLRTGELVWGTSNGAIIFEPDALLETEFRGRIFIQDIQVAGRSIREIKDLITKPVDEQKEIRLNYNQNSIALELLPVDVSSVRCMFSWKLEGIDAEWSNPSNLQTASYANLPSGDFVFKVRMFDNSLSQIIDERSVFLRIVPPFWDTWWFRFLMISMLILIVFFTFRFYVEHLKQLHAEDKIRFFTNMAHDIRTSLTLINAPIHELDKENQLSANGRNNLNLAIEQSKRLMSVSTQLLDIQKVDVGKGQLFLSTVDIVGLVRRRLYMFEATATKTNIEITFSSNLPAFSVAVDEIKIEKVVDNLLSNAIKYSMDGGKVEVTLMCYEKEWEFTVRDYGLGISVNAQKKLFREFYRGDNVVNSRMVGSGIGLLLTKNYVKMHNGQINVESKVGTGSLFIVKIPCCRVEASPAMPVVPEAAVNTSPPLPRGFWNPAAVPLPPDDESCKDAVNYREKKYLLLVEDNSDLQEFMRNTLQQHYIVSCAGNGNEAWEIITQKSPDLIISDIMMPAMDGFELCRLLKSTFETAHIPIILLTALSDKTNELEGLGLGADDYIIKPFDMELLAVRIDSIMKNRERIRERALRLMSEPESGTERILTNDLNDMFVRKAMEIVLENLGKHTFGKEEFALQMCVSPSLLYKKLKSLTGQSPGDFIRNIRLNKSMELLKTHKYSVTAVSEFCGFSAIGYFSTVFKRHFGKSPTEI